MTAATPFALSVRMTAGASAPRSRSCTSSTRRRPSTPPSAFTKSAAASTPASSCLARPPALLESGNAAPIRTSPADAAGAGEDGATEVAHADAANAMAMAMARARVRPGRLGYIDRSPPGGAMGWTDLEDRSTLIADDLGGGHHGVASMPRACGGAWPVSLRAAIDGFGRAPRPRSRPEDGGPRPDDEERRIEPEQAAHRLDQREVAERVDVREVDAGLAGRDGRQGLPRRPHETGDRRGGGAVRRTQDERRDRSAGHRHRRP